MMVSALTSAQAIDMGIMEAAVRQAEEANEQLAQVNEWADAHGVDSNTPAGWEALAIEVDHAEALALNEHKIVYVRGHGNRMYFLVREINDSFDHAGYVRPMDGGMTWWHGMENISTKPFN